MRPPTPETAATHGLISLGEEGLGKGVRKRLEPEQKCAHSVANSAKHDESVPCALCSGPKAHVMPVESASEIKNGMPQDYTWHQTRPNVTARRDIHLPGIRSNLLLPLYWM